jgi:hypothetical protein
MALPGLREEGVEPAEVPLDHDRSCGRTVVGYITHTHTYYIYIYTYIYIYGADQSNEHKYMNIYLYIYIYNGQRIKRIV